MKLDKTFIFPITVQFEDVDAHGIVHHPNYLKYLERARFHGIQQYGYRLEKIVASGSTLAVSEVKANYWRPAFVGQQLFVSSVVKTIGKSSLKLEQVITASCPNLEESKGNLLQLPDMIFSAELKLICVETATVKIKSIPLELKSAFRTSICPIKSNTNLKNVCNR